MPQLDKVQHEIFCRAMSRGMAQADAYAEAGYERSSPNASTLARKPEIKARIDELISEKLVLEGKERDHNFTSEKAAISEIEATGTISREWVLKQLVENTRMAREANQFAASNKAIEMIGKEIGMFQTPAPNEEDEKRVGNSENTTALPLDTVNKILSGLGFEGEIDLTAKKAMEKVEGRGRGRPPGLTKEVLQERKGSIFK